MTIDIQEIRTTADINRFFTLLYEKCVRFHPEVSFHDFITTDPESNEKAPSFSLDEATRLDKLMDDCWEIVGDDIFEMAMRIDKKVNGKIRKYK